jgi:hypothetical protein
MFQAYSARAKGFAERRGPESRTPPVEKNDQPQIDLLFRAKESKRDEAGSFTGD